MMDCRKTLILALSAILLQLSFSVPVQGVLAQGGVSAKEAADAAEQGEALDKFAKAASPSADVAKQVVVPLVASPAVAPVLKVEVPVSSVSKSVPVEPKVSSSDAKVESENVQKVLKVAEAEKSSSKQEEQKPQQEESGSNVHVHSKIIPVEKEDKSTAEAKITFPDIKEEVSSSDAKILEETPELTETPASESVPELSAAAQDAEVSNPKIDFYPSFGGFQFEKESKRPKYTEEVEDASNGPQITLIPSSMDERRPPAFMMDGDDEGRFAMEQQQPRRQQQQQLQQDQGFGLGMPPSASSFFSLFAYPSFASQEKEDYENRIHLRELEIERLKLEKAKLVSKVQQLERILAQTSHGQEQQQRRAKVMMIQQEQQRRRREAFNKMLAHRAQVQAAQVQARRRRQSPFENYYPSYQQQLHNPFQRYPQFSYPTFPRF